MVSSEILKSIQFSQTRSGKHGHRNITDTDIFENRIEIPSGMGKCQASHIKRAMLQKVYTGKSAFFGETFPQYWRGKCYV